MSDALDDLHDAIEKASVRFRGQTMSRAQRRLVSGASHASAKTLRNVWREGGRDQFMQGGRKGRRVSVDGRQAKTTPQRTQRAIAARLRKADDMDAIDKASPRGVGAKAAILRRRLSILARQPGAAYALGPRLAGLKARISAVRAKVKKSGGDPVDALYGEIEKAKGRGLIRGGSGKAFRRTAIAADVATGSRKRRLGRAATYLFDRQLGTMPRKGGGRRHHARTGNYK